MQSSASILNGSCFADQLGDARAISVSACGIRQMKFTPRTTLSPAPLFENHHHRSVFIFINT